MIYIWVSKEAENNTIFWKVFKKLYKTIKESISIDVANHFYSKSTRRTLKGHLSTQRALQGHSKGTLKAFQGHSEGTQALGQLGARGTRGTLFSRLLIKSFGPYFIKLMFLNTGYDEILILKSVLKLIPK